MKSLVAIHVTSANPDGSFSRSKPRLFWGDDADVEQLASRAGSAVRHDAHLSSVRTPQDLPLSHGPHPFRSAGLSITEVLAMMAGETHTNQPISVSPALSAFADRVGQQQDVAILHKFLPITMEMVGSNCVECENERARTLLRQCCVTTVPHALRRAEFTEAAEGLMSHEPVNYEWRKFARNAMQEMSDAIDNAGEDAPRELLDAHSALDNAMQAGNWLSHYIGVIPNGTSSLLASQWVGWTCADAAVNAGLIPENIIEQMRVVLDACSHRVVRTATPK